MTWAASTKIAHPGSPLKNIAWKGKKMKAVDPCPPNSPLVQDEDVVDVDSIIESMATIKNEVPTVVKPEGNGDYNT